MKKSKRILNALTYLFLTIGVVLILFPMYITVVTALKTPDEMSANFFGLPSTLYLGNFDEVIHKAYFGNFVFNSLFITLFSLLGIGVFVPLVSYAIARNFKKKYYRLIYILFISGAFVPFTVVMVPQIKLMSYLNAMNSYGLILLYWVFALSEGCLLTVSYVNSIPKELDEAAFIDGAGHWTTLTRIILPLCKPSIATVSLFIILQHWNAWFDGMLYIKDMSLKPLQTYLRSIVIVDSAVGETGMTLEDAVANATADGANGAKIFLAIFPIMCVYPFLQKYFAKGLVRGSVKE